MEPEDLLLVDVSDPFRRDAGVAWEGVDHFAEEVSENNNGIMAICGLRELGDEVNPNGLPRGVWYFERLSNCSGVLRVFLPGAGLTSFHILLDKGSHVWPPVVLVQPFQSAVYPRMPGSGTIMSLVDHFSLKILILGNIDPSSVVDQPIFLLPLR